MTTLTLNLEPIVHLTNEQFYQLCQANRDVRLERTAEGHLIVMPPTGWGTGNQNRKLTQRLGNWADADGTGLAFDSSTGFTLPNGAARSPDAAWVKRERLEALNPNPDQFLPLAPDFLIELRSFSDSLKILQQKMHEYMENGVRLGWLINPQEMPPARCREQQVEIYRLGQAIEILQLPTTISGEDVLPGFVLDLGQIL